MQTELANTINDENIEKLVRTFYPMVLKDALVGPFFVEKLGDDISSDIWEEHLVLISQFWAFVALGDENYTGNRKTFFATVHSFIIFCFLFFFFYLKKN